MNKGEVSITFYHRIYCQKIYLIQMVMITDIYVIWNILSYEMKMKRDVQMKGNGHIWDFSSSNPISSLGDIKYVQIKGINEKMTRPR